MLIPLLCTALCAPPLVQDDEAKVEVRLVTREGQSLSGTLTPADGGALGLLCEGFADELRIRAADVASVEILSGVEASSEPPAESSPEPAGLFSFVLSGGDRLQGRIVAMEGEEWTIDAVGLGEIKLAADHLVRAENLGGGALLYNGPTGTDGWDQRGELGFEPAVDHLFTTNPKGITGRDFGLDEPRDVHLEFAWKGAPRFRIGVGHGSGSSASSKGVTLEAWGTSLVAWSDAGKALDVVELVRDLERDSALALDLVVTPESVVVLQGEQELGTISRPKVGKHLSFANDGTHFELRAVRVYRGGRPERPTRRDASAITGYDAEAQAFLTETGPIEVAAVLGLDFAAQTAAEPDEDLFWLSYTDGRRVGGHHVGASPTAWVLQTAWSTVPVHCALVGLRDVRAVEEGAGRRRRRSSRSFLVAKQGEIAGELVSISAEGEILWRPSIAEGTATVDRAAVERVVINRETAYFVSSRKFPHQLRLRSGDMFRCRLLHVGETELRFVSPFGGEHSLGTERLKAIEFDVRKMDQFRELFAKEDPGNNQQNFFFGGGPEVRRETSDGFDRDSLERALSLPRKYKRRRFEHLILARTGDFLRTELLSWSEGTGAVYPGLSDDTRSIADDRLAAVVWLAEGGEEGAAEAKIGARVVLDEQTKLGLELSGAEDGFLIGTSPVLGELRIDLTHVISIELGSEALAAGTPYDEWILKPMREPFPDGQTAPQVGAAAPETRGKDLAGTEFALADYEGKVVLLDFWGHW